MTNYNYKKTIANVNETENKDTVLQVQDLAVRFELADRTVRAVDHNSFDIQKGETLGLVGESGSGKSVTARSIMGLIENPGVVDSGRIIFNDQNLLACSPNEIRNIRGKDISMIFQDPMGSLNPVFTIGEQLQRVLRLNRGIGQPSNITQWLNSLSGLKQELSEIEKQAAKLLERVGIPNPVKHLDQYPNQISGGQRQRVLIAMAIAADPEILIADEPTTALDVTIEAQIFDLLQELKDEIGMSILLITHDLSVVADVADRVMTMYAGNIVEKAAITEFYEDPLHPYTEALLDLVLRIDQDTKNITPIDGQVPDLSNIPNGCPFHPRCPQATEDCVKTDPELREVKIGHNVACIEVDGYNNAN